MKNIALSQADFGSTAWKNLAVTLNAHLLDLRGQLETLDATADQTAQLRGRISEIKGILAMANATSSSPTKQRLARSFVSEPLEGS